MTSDYESAAPIRPSELRARYIVSDFLILIIIFYESLRRPSAGSPRLTATLNWQVASGRDTNQITIWRRRMLNS